VSEQVDRPVIKAFNNLLAHTLAHAGKATGEEGRIAMAVSGDDKNAKRIVSGLIGDAGFDAVNAGSLSESWRPQPGMPAYCTDLIAEELKQALVNGVKEDAAGLRELLLKKNLWNVLPHQLMRR
jgi:predicted dinucleotide-binding enzyme